jgi:hypothetical protein
VRPEVGFQLSQGAGPLLIEACRLFNRSCRPRTCLSFVELGDTTEALEVMIGASGAESSAIPTVQLGLIAQEDWAG